MKRRDFLKLIPGAVAVGLVPTLATAASENAGPPVFHYETDKPIGYVQHVEVDSTGVRATIKLNNTPEAKQAMDAIAKSPAYQVIDPRDIDPESPITVKLLSQFCNG